MRSAYRDEDAAAARRMRDEAADVALERMIHLMIWGAVLTILFGLDAGRELGVVAYDAWVDEILWVALLVVAVVASFMYERYHAVSPANALSNILRAIWAAVGGGIVVIGFLGGVTALVPVGPHAGALAVLLGVGFVAARAIIGGRASLALAMLWWFSAVLFFFLGPGASFLAASAFFGLLFLPGLQGYVTHRLSHRRHIVA